MSKKRDNKFVTELVTLFNRGEELTTVDIRYLVDNGLIHNGGPGYTRMLTEKGYSYLPSAGNTITQLREEVEILTENLETLRQRNELLETKLVNIGLIAHSKAGL